MAALPEDVRGFGHVKQASIDRMRARQTVLLDQWHDPDGAKARQLEAAD